MPGARDALWEQAAEIAGRPCACGREHAMPQTRVALGQNTLEQLPALLWELQVRKPFMLMDGNTQAAADRMAFFITAYLGPRAERWQRLPATCG